MMVIIIYFTCEILKVTLTARVFIKILKPSFISFLMISRLMMHRELKSEDRNDKSIYNVASKSVGVRVQKVVDPEVAALLDDSDLSLFGSDAEDLEEDFVVRANIPEGGEDLGADVEGSEVVNEVTCGYVRYGGDRENVLGCGGVEKAMNVLVEARGYLGDEKQRVRRPLDEQFDSVRLYSVRSLFLI
ncbi:hypothetical protein Peur_046744 [Populus x canadensis]